MLEIGIQLEYLKNQHASIYTSDMLAFGIMMELRRICFGNKLAKARKTRTLPSTLGLKKVWAG